MVIWSEQHLEHLRRSRRNKRSNSEPDNLDDGNNSKLTEFSKKDKKKCISD